MSHIPHLPKAKKELGREEKELIDKLPMFPHASAGKKLSKEKLKELVDMVQETQESEKKMGREVLLELLKEWRDALIDDLKWHMEKSDFGESDEQAYKQIEEILEREGETREAYDCLTEIKAEEYERGLSDAHKALEKRPTIDKVFVEKCNKKINEAMTPGGMTIAEIIRFVLIEAGEEITEIEVAKNGK